MAETMLAAQQPKNEYATKYRTHTCGQLRAEDASEPGREGGEATLAGFVDRKVADDLFLIRDCYGKTLVKVAPGALPYVPEAFKQLNPEDVVQIAGKVALRSPAGTADAKDKTGVAAAKRLEADPDLSTGAIFVEASRIDVLSLAQPLPPTLSRDEVPYEDRFAFRQLYLRRPEMQARLEFRHRATQAIREFLTAKGFLEIQTPDLFWYDKVATVPEPVPVGGGKAFALPTGPVVLDQYLRPAAFDRCYQFLRVTRREKDPTPFHAQEHASLDINMDYVKEADFCAMVEQMLAHLWKTALGAELKTPFKRISYGEALAKYGTDKVDTRYGLEAADLPAAGPSGRAIRVPGGATLGESDLAALEKLARETKPPWTKTPAQVTFARLPSQKDPKAAPRPEGSAAKLFHEKPDLLKGLGAAAGDLVVVVTAENPETAQAAGAAVRAEIAKKLDLVPEGKHEFAWIHTYPFLQKDVRGNYTPSTVVFAALADEGAEFITDARTDPAKKPLIHSRAFDLLLDGVEIASGYIGCNSVADGRLIWENLWDLASSDLVRLRAPVESHRFGVPPHGGMNLGVDRLFALMLGASGLDDVMYFPKDKDCRDPMLEAPGPVPPDVAEELAAPPQMAAKGSDLELAEEVNKL